MSGWSGKHWWPVLGGLAVLFVVRYVETSDLALATIPVLTLVTFISLVAAVVSFLLILLTKQTIKASTYMAAGVSLLGLLSLYLLQISPKRLMIFVALAIFVAIIFVLVDWLKGRFSR